MTSYPIATMRSPPIASGRYIVPMADILRPFINQMSINGYRLCGTDLKEILQQILEWLDAYAFSGYAIKPSGFVIEPSRLIVNIKPVITVDGRMVLYDVDHEGRFTQACAYLAQDIFGLFDQLCLVMPGAHSMFILEKVLPNYSLIMYAPPEMSFDTNTNRYSSKESYVT